jgi:phthiodiolone/phenolphthiodiolone dimycocerosates ketoreductase
MLDIAGRYADGWWPAGDYSPEDYAAKLKLLRESADRAGRDPMAIVPCFILFSLVAADDKELAEILEAPLVKAIILQVDARELTKRGLKHPISDEWRGIQDLDPGKLTREAILDILGRTTPEMILSLVPHGTPKEVARKYKGFYDAGMRVPKILDYSGMAGLKFAAGSAAKVRETEDEFMRLVGDAA